MVNIKGIWKGFYEFGIGYVPPTFGSRVEFFVTILGGPLSFEGYSLEENVQQAVQDSAEIQGFIENNFFFVKTYPNTHECLNSGDSVKVSDREMEIIYRGEYSKEYSCFFGEWHFEMERFVEAGQEYVHECGGIWMMYKNEDD